MAGNVEENPRRLTLRAFEHALLRVRADSSSLLEGSGSEAVRSSCIRLCAMLCRWSLTAPRSLFAFSIRSCSRASVRSCNVVQFGGAYGKCCVLCIMLWFAASCLHHVLLMTMSLLMPSQGMRCSKWTTGMQHGSWTANSGSLAYGDCLALGAGKQMESCLQIRQNEPTVTAQATAPFAVAI